MIPSHRSGVATALALSFAVATPAAWTAGARAAEREHDSHEHGASTLDLVVDGTAVVLAFESPWANLVGFEHEPSTPEQEAAVEDALAALGDGAALFAFAPAAGCTLASADVASTMSAGEHDEDHGHDEEHEDEHHDEEHGDEEHAEAHGDEHEGDEHDEEHAESHSEVLVDYAFECEDPAAIGILDVALGERFESIETIAVQMAGPGGQGAESLSPEGGRVALDLAPVLGSS